MSKKTVGLAAGRPSERKQAAIEALTGNTAQVETVRVNFDLDRAEHMKLKIYAAKRGKSISDVLREFVERLE
jgi:hypothetical protein